MSKRQDPNPLVSSRFVDDSIGWAESPKDELSDEVMDTVWAVLDPPSINPRKRKIIWPDGQKLSINQSVQRIHADHQGFPLELIENHLLGWLEQIVVEPFNSEERVGELNRLTRKWIEAHERHAQTAQKGPKTRHS